MHNEASRVFEIIRCQRNFFLEYEEESIVINELTNKMREMGRLTEDQKRAFGRRILEIMKDNIA